MSGMSPKTTTRSNSDGRVVRVAAIGDVHYDGSKPGAEHGYQFHVGPMYSDVRGTVKITSTDPRRHPALRFN